ncbi:MAG: DNA-directed RNA polymerase subunit omega [Candidatus Eiseniibacteriota bacterium]|nr:MAG: DNA-directed RNA polymerase subunit omega [Candidatus Eisenbacteria bacterium]
MENPREESNGSFPNKYELAMIAAREARRMNELLRRSGEDEERKVTLAAMEKVRKGKVKHTYHQEEGPVE